MKDFEYFAPKNVSEALSLVKKYQDNAKVIAGGQSLLVVMKQDVLAPDYVIDINGLRELDYIKYDKSDGLRIGALTLHRTLETSPVIKKNYSVISEMEENVAVIQTRNWGTIGGNICHADPAGDPIPVFGVLNAKLKLLSAKGERIVDVNKFSKGYLETDMHHDELLLEIIIPPIPAHTGVAHHKLMVTKGDMGVVGAAASVTVNPKTKACEKAMIVLSNVGEVPVIPAKAQEFLKGKSITEDVLVEAGEIASTEVDPPADVHGTSAYRVEMVKVFVKRSVKLAYERALLN